MANKAAINSSTTQSRSKTRSANPSTKTKRIKARKEDKGLVEPEFGVEDQIWDATKGGVVYQLKNDMPITYYEDGKAVTKSIIYIEGASSIFKDDILAQYGDNIPRKKPLNFENRVFRVPSSEPLLQKYFWYAHNFGGASNIKMRDEERDARLEQERFDLIDANVQALKGMSLARLKAALNAIGEVIAPSAGQTAITAKLRKFNEKDPQKLNEILRSDDSELSFYAKKVYELGYVQQNGDGIEWNGPVGDKTYICDKPAGESVPNYLGLKLKEDGAFKRKWLQLFTDSINR